MNVRLVLTVWLLALSGIAAADEKKPNVVFIISDDLGAQSLGCYGNDQCQTPNINGLAEKGVWFTRAYCQYPVCGPSRAALMSGMYAQSIGVTSNGAAERFTQNIGDRPTMTEHFKNRGYHTARVSKIYHMRVPGDITAGVNGPDHADSWTERHNCQGPEQWSDGEHEHLTRERLKPDPKRSIHYNLGYGGAFYVVRSTGEGAEQPDHQAAAKAVEILKQRADDNAPFFLAVGLVRPHVPLVAPATYFEKYPAEEMKLAKRVANDLADIPRAGISKNSRGSGLTSDAKKQRVLEAYYAAVTFMDAQVGKIVAAVDELGLREKTIIVFTADHGYHLGEHDLWQKMSLHDESTRIPLIISAPGVKPGESPALCQQIDIYSTLAELCGLPIPDHVQGKSIAKSLTNPKANVHKSVYCLRGRNDHLFRTEQYALIRYANGDAELYNMEIDPHQFTNLAGDPKHKATLDKLQSELDAKLAEINR